MLAAGELAKKYNEEERGVRIILKDGKAQMVTASENSECVEKFLKADIEGELSRAALEVLSVVAYRGPISRSGIEDIRGVNCSFTLRHLLIRGLVERINNPQDARAYLYRITFDLLKVLGVEKVEDLPKYEELKTKKILEEELKERMEKEMKGEMSIDEKENDDLKNELLLEKEIQEAKKIMESETGDLDNEQNKNLNE